MIVIDKKELRKASKHFQREMKKAMLKAAKTSIRRTLPTLRKESNQKVRDRMRVRQSRLNRRHFVLEKNLKGRKIEALSGRLKIRDRQIGLIEFVRGQKLPRKQKGVKVSRRRQLRIEVRPGNVIQGRSRFIQKGKGGKYHVFRRQSGKATPLKRQSVPSPHILFMKRSFRMPIEQATGRKFEKEFVSNFRFFLSQRRRLRKNAG